MPYISSPPILSSLSKTVTKCPALLSCAAHASPEGPEPTTATCFPVLTLGGSGTTQPSSNPLSIIVHSMLFIVTEGSFNPNTHEPSHGAGHTLPVNSGKLFVLCKRSRASRHKPLNTRSFHSGIRLFIGHPEVKPPSISPV